VEVKTINISKIEATRRHAGGVGSTEDQVEHWIFQQTRERSRGGKDADERL
jgi:hypothetical protein